MSEPRRGPVKSRSRPKRERWRSEVYEVSASCSCGGDLILVAHTITRLEHGMTSRYTWKCENCGKVVKDEQEEPKRPEST